ncbi:acyl-CoA thioesterase [Rhodococcus kronopolitis]|uniref:Acyl-CoA thioesterase n=1 Tax=Rhodococcus kronopolitis TaxID=1460226 RepID=A0ABV9FSN6_9NOCA
MPDKKYTCEIQVRWGDSDRLGHVNNVLFLEYAQEARIKFFRDCIVAAGVPAAAMVVRKMEIEYLRPVTDESAPLTAEVYILRIGNSSFEIRNVMRDRHGNTCAVADGVLVGFDAETGTSVPLTEAARAALAEYAVTVTA